MSSQHSFVRSANVAHIKRSETQAESILCYSNSYPSIQPRIRCTSIGKVKVQQYAVFFILIFLSHHEYRESAGREDK